jgi:hypothetical protein
MRKTICHTLALGLLALSLQGCGAALAMRGLEGHGYCPTGLHERAGYIYQYLNEISSNTPVETVVQTIGLPEVRTQEVLSNKSRVEVWHYRTGHENCRGLPTETDFSPLVVGNGKVYGGGLRYYQQYIGPHVVQRYQMTSGSKVIEDVGELMYPFNKIF